MNPAVNPVRRLSWLFGILIGAMWMAEVLLGNLAGISHPQARAMGPMFALAAVGMTGIAGLVSAHRTGSIGAALKVGVWSGLISGAILLVTMMSMVVLFHDVMMHDPSNIHEFARSAHRAPTPAELSSFIYTDALGGGLNHLWIGPLLGLTVGGVGAVLGKVSGTEPSRPAYSGGS